MACGSAAVASAPSPSFLGRPLQQPPSGGGRHLATAAAAAAAGSGAGAGAGAGAVPVAAMAGPRRLSPEADAFQKHWYGEVNTGPVSGGGRGGGAHPLAAPSADEQAAVYAKHSQAVRLLVGWLRERRACPPDSEARRTYDVDGRLANRAMQVIRDLEYARPDKRRPWQQQQQQQQRGRQGQGEAAAAAAATTTATTGGSGHLSLDEMIEAVETLAADAPSMGFTLTDRHFELLLDLYVQKAEGGGGDGEGVDAFRAGLAARAAAVQQQMALQLVHVTPTALGALLTCLALDTGGRSRSGSSGRGSSSPGSSGSGGSGARAMSAAEKLAAGVRLVDAHLRPITGGGGAAAAASGPGAGVVAAARLRERLEDLMVTALEQRNWAAYGKVRSVVLAYTRQPPSRRVLAAALSAAAATNAEALDTAAAAEEEQEQELGAAAAGGGSGGGGGWRLAAAREQAANALEQLAERHKREPPYTAVPLPSPPQQQQQQDQQPQQGPQGPAAAAYKRRLVAARWREQAAKAAEEALLEAEESGLVAVLRAAAAAGDDALADQAYDRLRWTAARRLQLAAATAAAAGGEGAAAATAAPPAVGAAATAAAIPPSATLAVLALAAARGDYRRAVGLVAALAELDQARKRYAGEGAPAAQQLARRAAKDRAAMEAAVSAYGGLGPLSEQLVASEAATVAYYTELLRHVADAAAGGGAAAPFGGSAVPFGPPLRAAAARRDLTSVAGLIKQMRELGCAPTADSYAAVIDASYRAGKPERVPGLLALMAEEGLSASAAVWELQLRAAAELPANDASGGGLAAVAQRALAEAAPEREGARGVVAISGKVLEELRSLAQVRGDGRAAALLGSLLTAQEEVRRAWRQAKKVAAWQAAQAREAAREQRQQQRWQRRDGQKREEEAQE
ncbi:hypothetical protein HYH02_014048 [Chlamydomonas schloesseri]|uniref:Pentacotripeptide-repeat region of PRORP domain-containing protein n=1 Tax=Chlamydomonas schloesseri TaxID=2026947 RepID=A0A835SPH2_9CHLO|nr:hypothetical protein HYH02_014048 [Chlamydomonas schloesseri]|eukprot:KAG2429391.1 hypothetical protein HYH02_014048 [Chlamydomonas schloesseri]